MQLSSVAIPHDSTIELTYCEPSCGGQNVSPDLTWSDAPDAARSFAVTVFDPDAPTGSGWWHWIAFDIPGRLTSLEPELGPNAPIRQWVNDYGYLGYGGPCPPPGQTHRYVFTVHALDIDELPVPEQATSAACRFTLQAHSLASASFTATFGLEA